MKRPRWWPRRSSDEPVRVELQGLPRQLVPTRLTIEHLVKREPWVPRRIYAVIESREGYHWRGPSVPLSDGSHRVHLPIPTSAQLAIKHKETGEYVPVDHIQVELAYGSY